MSGRSFLFVLAGMVVIGAGMAAPIQDEAGQTLYVQMPDGEFVPLGSPNAQQENSQEKPIEVKEAAASDSFHRGIIKAAWEARKSGKISRRQFNRFRALMMMPAVRAQAKEMAIAQMKLGDTKETNIDFSSINWEEFAAFLERLVPIVLQLLEAILELVHEDQQDWEIKQKVRDIQDRIYRLQKQTDSFRQVLAA